MAVKPIQFLQLQYFQMYLILYNMLKFFTHYFFLLINFKWLEKVISEKKLQWFVIQFSQLVMNHTIIFFPEKRKNISINSKKWKHTSHLESGSYFIQFNFSNIILKICMMAKTNNIIFVAKCNDPTTFRFGDRIQMF